MRTLNTTMHGSRLPWVARSGVQVMAANKKQSKQSPSHADEARLKTEAGLDSALAKLSSLPGRGKQRTEGKSKLQESKPQPTANAQQTPIVGGQPQQQQQQQPVPPPLQPKGKKPAAPPKLKDIDDVDEETLWREVEAAVRRMGPGKAAIEDDNDEDDMVAHEGVSTAASRRAEAAAPAPRGFGLSSTAGKGFGAASSVNGGTSSSALSPVVSPGGSPKMSPDMASNSRAGKAIKATSASSPSPASSAAPRTQQPVIRIMLYSTDEASALAAIKVGFMSLNLRHGFWWMAPKWMAPLKRWRKRSHWCINQHGMLLA